MGEPVMQPSAMRVTRKWAVDIGMTEVLEQPRHLNPKCLSHCCSRDEYADLRGNILEAKSD